MSSEKWGQYPNEHDIIRELGVEVVRLKEAVEKARVCIRDGEPEFADDILRSALTITEEGR